MRRGVRIGVDVGDARVGIARSDPDGILATPVETWQVQGQDADAMAAHIADIVREYAAIEAVIGLPTHLSGADGAASNKAENIAEKLCKICPELSVRLVDERQTTVMAHAILHENGKKEKRHRRVVDQVAAVLILQQALDIERQTGHVPGRASNATR